MSTVTNCVLFKSSNNRSSLYSDSALKSLWSETDSILLNWNNRFTTDSIHSEIYAINNRKQQTVPISEDLFHMLNTIKSFDQEHPNLFDPTIGPLKKFWNPTCKECSTPLLSSSQTEQQLKEILPLVDFSSVHINRVGEQHTIFFENPATQLEVGGVSKGFILNRLKDFYIQKGYTNFVISMGGDVFSVGGKPSGKPFTLGIQHPDNLSLLATTFQFKEGAVVTSGNYERYRIDGNGERIHHIYSPVSGYPSKNNKSVTIATKDPTLADIYSTALFSLPADSILTIVNNNKSLECYIIDAENEIYYSKGFFNLTQKL